MLTNISMSRKNRKIRNEIFVEKKEGKECFDRRQHYTNLIIDGYCFKCLRTFSLPADDTKVFPRLEQLKRAGV